MERSPHHRIKLLILLAITLGLVSLGMKLPNLQELASSTTKPKPRPRAVIKTQIKSCQESIKKLQVAMSSDGPVRNTLANVSEFIPLFVSLPSGRLPVDLIISNSLSRAPPSHS